MDYTTDPKRSERARRTICMNLNFNPDSSELQFYTLLASIEGDKMVLTDPEGLGEGSFDLRRSIRFVMGKVSKNVEVTCRGSKYQ